MFTTANFENWAGEISEIGAIYPFVGTEKYLAIVGLVFWVWWHIKQTKIENAWHEEQVKKWGNKDSLLKIIEGEDPETP